MIKDYVVYIFDKAYNVKKYKFCDNMKEVEDFLFRNKEILENFEIYKTVDTDECIDLVELCFKRFLKLKKEGK